MRFAVVTPVLNGDAYVEDTVRSVIDQARYGSGDHEIDYVVKDGGSTDATVEVATRAADGRARVISQPDTSMYDAVAQGFRLVEGDVFLYINAGDMLLPGAFDAAAKVWAQESPYWACGNQGFLTQDGNLFRTRTPLRFRKSWIRQAAYGRVLNFIQQESTFWSATAMRSIDLDEFASFRLAGDFYLWSRFARVAEPTIVRAGFGAFRYHGGHLSDDRDAYWAELRRVAEPLRPWTAALAALERPAWYLPERIGGWLNPAILRYVHTEATWRRWRRPHASA